MKKVLVFGSTGFVGKKAVQILYENPQHFEVHTLVANNNVHLLALQARLLNAQSVVIADETLYQDLKGLLAGTAIKVSAGKSGIKEAASTTKAATAVMAISGVAALEYVVDLLESDVKCIALANKESVVCGGALLMEAAKRRGISIVPLDSEHNAVFRILHDSGCDNLMGVTITASGGPFLRYSIDEMKNVELKDTLTHPIWRMGRKISIDSATMANKALEVIEAKNFFNLDHTNINVLVHPEAVVHAFVTYRDGASAALMYPPDMAIPMLHALYWPEKIRPSVTVAGRSLCLASCGQLTFMEPDLERFPALKIGFDIIKNSECHSASIVFNAANEVAVAAFLDYKIQFLEIVSVVLDTMDKAPHRMMNSITDIMEYDLFIRDITKEIVTRKQNAKLLV